MLSSRSQLTAILVGLGICCAAEFAIAGEPAPGQLYAGWETVDITPSAPVVLDGSASSNPAEGRCDSTADPTTRTPFPRERAKPAEQSIGSSGSVFGQCPSTGPWRAPGVGQVPP